MRSLARETARRILRIYRCAARTAYRRGCDRGTMNTVVDIFALVVMLALFVGMAASGFMASSAPRSLVAVRARRPR